MTRPAAKAASSDDEAQERSQRGTRQLLLARACLFACGYVVTVILARELGPTAYGIYGVVMSQLLWLEMLMTAGVPGATAKLIADGRHDRREVEHSAQALLLGLAALLLAVSWVLAPRVASLMQIPDGEVLFRIAIIDLPFAAVYASYGGILAGRRRFGVLAVAQGIYSVAKLAGVVALIGLGFSIGRALIANVFPTCVVCAVLAVRLRRRGFRPRRAIMGEIAAIGVPMALYLVSSQVLVNLDLWSLKGLWEGEGEVVGYYVAAMNLARTLTLIPAVQAPVLFASVAWAVALRDTVRARQHIHDATRFAVVVAVGAWVILGLDASEVLAVLFSSGYADGQHFLPLQLAGFGLYVLLDAFSNSLMAAGRHWSVAGALGISVPLAWFSNYLLIPWLGPLGAATSLVLGMAIGVALTGVMAHRYFGSVIQSSMLLRVLVAAAVVGLVSAVCPVQGPLVLVKLVPLGGLYLLLLYVLGEITGKDFGLPGKTLA